MELDDLLCFHLSSLKLSDLVQKVLLSVDENKRRAFSSDSIKRCSSNRRAAIASRVSYAAQIN
jgi:hypothetical protein